MESTQRTHPFVHAHCISISNTLSKLYPSNHVLTIHFVQCSFPRNLFHFISFHFIFIYAYQFNRIVFLQKYSPPGDVTNLSFQKHTHVVIRIRATSFKHFVCDCDKMIMNRWIVSTRQQCATIQYSTN